MNFSWETNHEKEANIFTCFGTDVEETCFFNVKLELLKNNF